MMVTGTGAYIRYIRQQKEFSLSQLAYETKISKSTLSKYENDQVPVPMDALDTIAKALGKWPEVVALSCIRLRYSLLSKGAAAKSLNYTIKLVKDLADETRYKKAKPFTVEEVMEDLAGLD